MVFFQIWLSSKAHGIGLSNTQIGIIFPLIPLQLYYSILSTALYKTNLELVEFYCLYVHLFLFLLGLFCILLCSILRRTFLYCWIYRVFIYFKRFSSRLWDYMKLWLKSSVELIILIMGNPELGEFGICNYFTLFWIFIFN